MLDSFPGVAAIAVAAGIASPLGGLIAIWTRPSTLLMSVTLGFAAGVLLATIGFEMLPGALELSGLGPAVGGFIVGFVLIYAFDLYMHGGVLVGEKAHRRVRRFSAHNRPRDGGVAVLAGGTSAEELIEGVSIGVASAINPGLGAVVALAIVIDNASEAMSIGEIIRNERVGDKRSKAYRILGWTSLIGASVLVSSIVGWLFLRDMSPAVLGVLFGAGAGGMFYLTVTNLVPEAEERHYQQGAAIAMGVGFMIIFALSTLS
jgi:ZIP family zinc transporter